MMNFYKILFFNTMIIGTMISISSLTWLTSWIGLEINLLSIIPLMKNHKNKYSTEATLKYFITQVMASILLIFSIIIFTNSKNFSSSEIATSTSILVTSALMMKMGAAPLHFWLPEVTSGMNWEMIYIILTWQKIAPMILLTYTVLNTMFLSFFIISSSIISGLQSLNQTCFRKILTYSSINHVSWMISAIMNSSMIWLYYFIIYMILNFNIIIILKKYNIYFINQLLKMLSFNKNLKLFFSLNFLSLGGLPPFLGFFPKWLTINLMTKNNFYFLSIIMIIFTMISLFIYLRVSFSMLIINTDESLLMNFKKTSYTQFFINLVSIFGLMFCIILSNYM
uniref:NADH-ubiquinone oxidoreductase chain 2 n=1 Tax=Curculionidae sp. 2 AH-2016 TaxID=1903828 RepID=A0A343C2N0_9CUCU|nr:NADH dehydrogenase subunit 2 [Curculionidae sp. 2 AH-2016]